MWTSLIQYADYVWLACRTDPDAPKHRGLSVLVVPTTHPGFSWTPVRTMAGLTTSATYYRDIRVPAGMRVGDENAGWPLITNQLNHERVALTSSAPLRVALAEVTRLGRRDEGAGRQPGARRRVGAGAPGPGARVDGGAAADELRVAWGADQGDAAAGGRLGDQGLRHRARDDAYRLLMEVMGPAGTVRDGSPGAVLRGRVERMHRAALVLTFGGGTNEIQRDIIAAAGLGCPPVGRR